MYIASYTARFDGEYFLEELIAQAAKSLNQKQLISLKNGLDHVRNPQSVSVFKHDGISKVYVYYVNAKGFEWEFKIGARGALGKRMLSSEADDE